MLALVFALLLPEAARAVTVEGRVIHPEKREAVAGLRIHLLGFSRPSGTPIQLETRADSDGRFRFTDLASPAMYMVTAKYKEIRFPAGRVVFEADDAEQSKNVVFHIYEPSDDPSRIELGSSRWVISGGEAGRHVIQQTLTVKNPDLTVVKLADGEPPVARIGVAEGHNEIRNAFGRIPDELELRDGLLELRGPIFPGEHTISFSYSVASGEEGLSTELHFPDDTAEFELYIRDVGIIVEAPGLHPARSIRDEEGTYEHYLGFDLPAGARIPLRVSPLPSPDTGSRWANAALAALVAGAFAFFVGYPLGRDRIEETESVEPEESPEKAALFAALRDLEHDFETGKLSTADRDRLRKDLRSDALKALARERGAPSHTAAGLCSCGHRPAAGDRFCGGCGRAL